MILLENATLSNISRRIVRRKPREIRNATMAVMEALEALEAPCLGVRLIFCEGDEM